ncbi:MAG: hypothetical protein WCG01_00125 [bacterium]
MDIKITVEKINNDFTSLKTEDGLLINWPTNRLPKSIQLGQFLVFNITDHGQKAEPEKLAKELLNEILNIE